MEKKQHLGSKGKNIKHIFNRTDFWGRGNHVSSIDVWGRCNDRIALGQTFFCCKKTPTVFEFWALLPIHPPPKKTLQCFVVFCCNQSLRVQPKIPTPPFLVSRFCCFLAAQVWSWTPSWTHRLDGSPELRFLKVVRSTSGKWRHEGLEPEIFLLPYWKKEINFVGENCPKKIRGVSPGCFCFTYEITPLSKAQVFFGCLLDLILKEWYCK